MASSSRKSPRLMSGIENCIVVQESDPESLPPLADCDSSADGWSRPQQKPRKPRKKRFICRCHCGCTRRPGRLIVCDDCGQSIGPGCCLFHEDRMRAFCHFCRGPAPSTEQTNETEKTPAPQQKASSSSDPQLQDQQPLLEFGHRLCHQDLLLTTEAKLAPTQASGLTRLVVRDMAYGDRVANTAGIILPVGKQGKPELARAHYHATLADEDALSAGASGIAPCACRCWVVNKPKQLDIDRGVQPLTSRGAGIVDITCTNKAAIVLKGGHRRVG